MIGCGRSPHGGRGLKLRYERVHQGLGESLPARGAWIETHTHELATPHGKVAPRTGGVD